MKRLLTALGASLLVVLASWGTAFATSTFITQQGGTGTSSPSGILYGDNGATSHLNTVTIGSNLTFSGGTLSASGGSGSPGGTSGQLQYNAAGTFGGVATTTVTCSGSTSCTSFVTIGSSPITISSSGGGGTGLSTTSPVSAGNLLVYSATGAGSAFGVATSTITLPAYITYSGTLGSVVGGASGNLAISQLPIANGGTATTTFYNGGVNFYNSTLGSISQGTLASDFFYDVANKRLGLGVSAPGTRLTVSNQTSVQTAISGSIAQFVGLDANPLRITFDTHNNGSTSGTAFMFRRSRGTAGTPLADVVDDVLGSLNFRGYGDTGYAAGSTGLISAKAEGTFTDTSMPTAITFDTTPSASVTALERLRITGSGKVGIGTTTPLNILDLSASDSGTLITNASAAMESIVNTNTTANNFSDLAFTTVDSTGNTVSAAKISGIFTSHTNAAVSTDLSFVTDNAGTLRQKAIIKNNGDVGIGSSTPHAVLAVHANGTSPTKNIAEFAYATGGAADSATTTVLTIASSTVPTFLVGTTTPFGAGTSNAITLSSGTTGTTTINLGESGNTGAKSCLNMQSDTGAIFQLFIHGSSLQVVAGACTQ